MPQRPPMAATWPFQTVAPDVYSGRMALSHATTIILPPYQRGPVAPSLARRSAVVALQLLAAAIYGVAAVILPPELIVVLIVPVVVCFLIALWLMPDRRIFPLRPIMRMFGVTLFLMLAWPNYIAVVLPGLPWLTPTRMALFGLTFLFLYSVSTSSPLRHHLLTVAGSSKLLWTTFLIWQAAMVVSLVFSPAIAKSMKGLFDNELRLVQMFFIGCLVFAPRGGATWAVRLMLIMAAIWAVDGFIELRLGYPPWAYSIPSFMKIDDNALANILGSQARSDDGIYRVRGPYVNSLVLSEFFAMCTPFIIHFLLTGRRPALRVAMAFLWPLVIAAIVVTQSRLGLVGTLLSVGLYVPFWAFRQWRANGTSIIGPSLLFGAPLVAGALIGVIFSSHTLTMRILGGGAQASSDEARTVQRNLAIPKIATHPLGYGLDQSAKTLGFYSPSGLLTVDNHYLTTLLDIGIPGAIGFYGMFLAASVIGVRVFMTTATREHELAGPLGIMCFNFVVLKSVLSEEHSHSLALLLVGMSAALWARERGLVDPDNLFPQNRQPG